MKIITKLTVMTFVFLAISGCASFSITSVIPGTARSAGSSEIMSIPKLTNNSETQLEAGTYRGITIDHNSVLIIGRGNGQTVIEGDVIIKGNNCVIGNLTIRGNVTIEGNNADLTGAAIRGEVNSTGKNNKW